jgi:hypothetical protein
MVLWVHIRYFKLIWNSSNPRTHPLESCLQEDERELVMESFFHGVPYINSEEAVNGYIEYHNLELSISITA